MITNLEHIILKTELSQSCYNGEFYNYLLEKNEGLTFSKSQVEDLSELLNSIILKYDSLTEFQKSMLVDIFKQFDIIRVAIDPKRLKSFTHFFNSDDELLLSRKTENGIINIIINPEDCLAFSFIPQKIEENRQFYFIHKGEDFEKLAYDFFSH